MNDQKSSRDKFLQYMQIYPEPVLQPLHLEESHLQQSWSVINVKYS